MPSVINIKSITRNQSNSYIFINTYDVYVGAYFTDLTRYWRNWSGDAGHYKVPDLPIAKALDLWTKNSLGMSFREYLDSLGIDTHHSVKLIDFDENMKILKVTHNDEAAMGVVSYYFTDTFKHYAGQLYLEPVGWSPRAKENHIDETAFGKALYMWVNNSLGMPFKEFLVQTGIPDSKIEFDF